jgi:hypothetical protein
LQSLKSISPKILAQLYVNKNFIIQM